MDTASANAPASLAQVYQFHISLQEIEPPIWRRFQVRDDTPLGTLHEIVQFVMGWEDQHLHEFVFGNTHFGIADDEMGMDVQDEDDATLRSLGMKVGSVLGYEYDFGDGWEHELLLEEILPPVPATRYPICVEGERACPPEDCGGPFGYENILRILAMPAKKRSEDDLYMLDWVGEEYDPEEFDIAAVIAELAQFAPTRTSWGR